MNDTPTQPRERINDIVLVDMSEDARDAADKRLTEELQQGGRFRRFLGSVWKGGMANAYYLRGI